MISQASQDQKASISCSSIAPHHRRQVWAAHALLLALVLAWFSPWLISGKVLAPFDIVTELLLPWRGDTTTPKVNNHFVNDAVSQYIPYRMFADRSFREDGYLGWNPLIFGGTAQHANTMALYYDWSVQLHRILGFWHAWHIGLALQFLIAGCGMLHFLLSRKIDPPVALIGAIAYMGNWQFIAWIYHHWALSCFCWMPWVLWALYLWRSGKLQAGSLVPVFIALAFLGGTLQHAVFVVIGTACIWLGWAWEDRHGKQKIVRNLLWFAFWGLLGISLSAFMFEPTISAFLENLASGHKRGGLVYENGFLQPVLNLLSYTFYAFPFVMGSTQTLDLWKVLRSDLFNVGFFGTIPVLCAFLGLFYKGVPAPAKVLIIAGLLIPLTPLVGLLYHRINLLWILGGCWGTAEFLRALTGLELRRLATKLAIAMAVIAGIWLIASITLILLEARIDATLESLLAAKASTGQFGLFKEWVLARAQLLPSFLSIWNPIQFFAFLGALLSVVGLAFLTSRNAAARYLTASGVALQLSLVWFQWTTWSKETNPYAQTGLVPILQSSLGPYRLASFSGPVAERLFPPNTLDPSGIAITGGYDSIHPITMATGSEQPWDFPGVSHFLGQANQPHPEGWNAVWSGADWTLFRNPFPSLVRPEFSSETFEQNSSIPCARPTLNSLSFIAPKGAYGVTIFENYHYDWKWRQTQNKKWNSVSKSDMGALFVDFGKPLVEPTSIELRFIPSQLPWVRASTFGAGAILLALAFVVRRPRESLDHL